MDPDACLVMSGFPGGASSSFFVHVFRNQTKRLVKFPEIRTALAEFSSPQLAARVLANEGRLLKETGLQVSSLEPLLSPKEDVTTQHSQVYQLQRQLKTVKQNLQSKEQQLQDVTKEKECLKSAFSRESEAKRSALTKSRKLEEAKVHLKNQAEADKKTIDEELRRKEEQLQQVETVNESLQAALRRETEAKNISFNLSQRLEEANSHLKDELEAEKRENERMREQISATHDLSNPYEMSCDPRGVAVIINNIRFEDMADREGAEGDTGRLREVFEGLGFTVVTFTDLDHAKMVAAMKDQGKADHSNHDCFVCCIMSHGTMGKVFSSDDVGIDICELIKPVNAMKCPSLKGKPKLFFIQACQGERIQRRESFDGDYDAKPVPFICHEADFFLGLATVPGYVARRDGDGAPYVKHLAKLLRDFGPTHDLSAIMSMVCDKMNEINDDKFGWISSNHSTLRKNVIFKAK
ncbi:PREDICTED: caspase-8-like [Branchiostoma belcheri]|uniref:Caspase-8-like n=1 Tax=Branchiostoma belcheri TaxID=7741 RepID=A0A6P4ZP26_BRABE|nr:PREDICTED: caspase-8-like [Branchiostoma belcheri]